MRPASMASALSQPPSRAWRPNSPKVTVLPRLALPFTRPRSFFRTLTRLGISAIAPLLGVLILPLINPGLDTDLPLCRVCLRKAKLDARPQSRQRNAAEHARLLASHLRA